MNYNDFSLFYDGLTNDVDYQKRTDYILKIFEKFDRKPTLLLDLACGTGGFSIETAKRGISVIGVDISVGMLNVARQKVLNQNADVLLLNQDAAELDLYGTVDGAICCLDSVNHITDGDDVQKAFDKVSLFLEKDRLFVFDVNTEFKHKNVLSGKNYVLENDQVFCVWQNSDCQADGTVDIELDFFKKDGDVYERYSEDFSERAYPLEDLTEKLKKSGLEVLAIFGDLSFSSVTDTDERAVFVARKVR